MLKNWLADWRWYHRNPRLKARKAKLPDSPFPARALAVELRTLDPPPWDISRYTLQRIYGCLFLKGLEVTLWKGHPDYPDRFRFWIAAERLPWYYPRWPLIIQELCRQAVYDRRLRNDAAWFLGITEIELLAWAGRLCG